MTAVAQGLHNLPFQEAHLGFRLAMGRVALVADKRQLPVVLRAMKRLPFLGPLGGWYMALETEAVPEREAHLFGFLKVAQKVSNCISCCLCLDSQLVCESGAVVAVNTSEGRVGAAVMEYSPGSCGARSL